MIINIRKYNNANNKNSYNIRLKSNNIMNIKNKNKCKNIEANISNTRYSSKNKDENNNNSNKNWNFIVNANRNINSINNSIIFTSIIMFFDTAIMITTYFEFIFNLPIMITMNIKMFNNNKYMIFFDTIEKTSITVKFNMM